MLTKSPALAAGTGITSGALTCEKSSELIRAVVEFRDRLVDAFFCRGAYMRLSVDDARNGFNRYTSEIGYVEYSGSWHG